jgi:hypothetical protein
MQLIVSFSSRVDAVAVKAATMNVLARRTVTVNRAVSTRRNAAAQPYDRAGEVGTSVNAGSR